MRARNLALLAFLIASSTQLVLAQQIMNIPLRISMGGRQVLDSYGRIWLADGPGPGDALNIRPDDLGGGEWAENWFIQNFQLDSLDALGFDSTNPEDVYLFNTIRWDQGAFAPDFRMEIPMVEGDYTVNLYFSENCCPDRHFQIELQGAIVEDDVSYLDYDVANPAIGRAGVISFPGITVGPDKLLKIGLLPCGPALCPGSIDTNAIINALEVISAPECDHLGLDFNCAFRGATDDVRGAWNQVPSAEAYRIFKNGAQFGADLPGAQTSFVDPNPRTGGEVVTYVIQALDGGVKFRECRCTITAKACPSSLICSVDQGSGEVSLSWEVGGGFGVTGFEVRRNGALLITLPPTAGTFEDTPVERILDYTITPVSLDAVCAGLACRAIVEANDFTLPIRINMGGAQTTDSRGRVWLGDGPGAGDPLSIRPDDASGTNWIESWCVPESTSLRSLGFDPTNPSDRYIFSTIRFDTGNDGIDFYVELPVPNADDYFVSLYFNECCCANRHFKLEINGEIVDEDVSYLDYAAVPAGGKVGRLLFKDISVTDGILRIGILPCLDCQDPSGLVDTNAIINAIEVSKNPCTDPSFRLCPSNLVCTFTAINKRVTGTWDAPLCIVPESYDLLKNGEVIASLPGASTSFIDTLTARVGFYEVRPILAAGVAPCDSISCTIVNDSVPFEIPLRLNMGGRFRVDSRGQKWIGDGSGPGDQLGIRVDPAGGTNWIENWCTAASQANPDAMRSLGLDPKNPNDQGIYNTIRWDLGPLDLNGDEIEFRLELPVPNGDYLLNFYFTECCCMNRHFMLEAEGDIIDEDVSSQDYSSVPIVGRTGRLSFDHITVSDGSLSLGILPCLACPFDPFPVLDTNAIIDAIEVLPGGTTVRTCPRDLLCTLEGGSVSGTWTGPVNVVVTGYDVFRDGVKIGSLPAGATSFADPSPPCQRLITYEVVPLSTAADFLCPGIRLISRLFQPDCPFSTPVRINMGGTEVIDSHGDYWFGDGPGAGDPLNIRPDDLGGDQWAENWSLVAFQPDSLDALGFDSTHPSDVYLFNTIRWDVGLNPPDFLVELPMDNGTYTVNLYFNEGCCIGRHFKIEIEGVVVDDDVSYLDYDVANPALGRVGRLTFDATVEDDVLNVGFLPCPECFGVQDTNAIIQAIEVLGGGVVRPLLHRGDVDQNNKLELTDAVQILGFLFLGQPTKVPLCRDAADADDNGKIELTDAVRVLGYLFLGGTPPSPPGPPPAACGLDPTDDTLGDCTFACP